MSSYKKYILFFSLLILSGCSLLSAQADTNQTSNKNIVSAVQPKALLSDSAKQQIQKTDSITKAVHIPRIATERSAIIPGWGQAYNREYWKIPIVYGVLAIPAVAYFYNQGYYKKTKFAYEARFKEQNGDSSDVSSIDPELANLGIGSLQNYRNSFRRDRDYSVLWFLLAWGIQVVDATVFAHLKQFNVSNDLSMQIHPNFNPVSKTPVLSLSLNLREPERKAKVLAR